LPVGAMLPWKRARAGRVLHTLRYALGLALALALLIWAMSANRSALAPVGVFLGVWLLLGAAADLWQRTGRGGIASRVRRMARLPRADWGKAVAHGGLGIVITGIAGLLAWEVEDIRVARPGETFTVAGYEIALEGVSEVEGPNYLSAMAEMTVARGGREITRLFPERRVYPVAGMPTTEAAIDNGALRDIYLVIGERQPGGGWTVRAHVKPLANWIWGGAILMAAGGLLSLSDRRYRVAAGARRRAGNRAAADAGSVAE